MTNRHLNHEEGDSPDQTQVDEFKVHLAELKKEICSNISN